MFLEFCPLRNVGQSNLDIPVKCETNCEAKWEKAMSSHDVNGPYDFYSDSTDEGDCWHDSCDVENSDTAITALGQHTREYVVVDRYDCGKEIGEQGFKFECLLPLEQ